MRYIKVTWIHDFVDEPIQYYHEIDDANYETRKVVIFKNGKVTLASKSLQNDETFLSFEPIPDVTEINKDAQFIARDIEKNEFDQVWNDNI